MKFQDARSAAGAPSRQRQEAGSRILASEWVQTGREIGGMSKRVCASGIRNIRYIVGAQGLNPQQKAQQGCNIRYSVDGQGLRYVFFWHRGDKN